MADEEREEGVEEGTLYLVATPIGNLGDISPRARMVLGSVGAIACEDTRRTLKLLSALELHRPQHFFACHDHNEQRAASRVVELLRTRHSVALCSDAGMPLVSDPGYRVVRATLDAGFEVRAIPGPSAALAALAVSGLAPSSFVVKGFPPRKPGKRLRFFADEAASPHTLVVFESARRLRPLVESALEALGDREAAICFELTKRFETVRRGRLSVLLAGLEEEPRGEATVVIDGLTRKAAREEDEG